MKGMNPSTDAKEISRANGCRRAVEAPRGHAKSTNFTFKDSIHSAVYAYKHYEIILSDSSEQAEGFLSDIKTELEENAALREDFGELEGRVWKASVILLSNGVKIEALGAGKKIRGRRHKQWRPDLILCDDLENDENVNTAEQRKKLRDWFYKAVEKAGDTYTDIVYIGTLLHYDALLANVAKNPEYEAVRYKGVISFADEHGLVGRLGADLHRPREPEAQGGRRGLLQGERGRNAGRNRRLVGRKAPLLRPHGYEGIGGRGVLQQRDPERTHRPGELRVCRGGSTTTTTGSSPDFSEARFLFVAANDPSLGKNRKSDTSAIIAVAKDTSTGYMYVVIADIAKRSRTKSSRTRSRRPAGLKQEYKKPLYKFGVETVQFQYYFAEIMWQKSAEIGEYLPSRRSTASRTRTPASSPCSPS